jgi:predicted SAM-dependent methyltransferase
MIKTFLHVGCGPKHKNQTTRAFASDTWQELRLDIDPAVKPDIVGTMLDMSAVASESVDALFSSHNIEHLYPHEVSMALQEFLRVLKPDGFLGVYDKFMVVIIKPPLDTPRSLPNGYSAGCILER